jgi:hypothetical protein
MISKGGTMGTPMRVEINTPFIVQGTTLRLRDDEVPRSFVPLELATSERDVIRGSAAGIYDDYDKSRSYLLGLHCRIKGQEFHCYLRPEHDRSYTVYRIDRIAAS